SHVLDGIHDSHFAVLVAISVEVVRIPFNCAGFDDRVVVFAVVIPLSQNMTSLELNGSSSIESCSHVILTTSTVTCACGAGTGEKQPKFHGHTSIHGGGKRRSVTLKASRKRTSHQR